MEKSLNSATAFAISAGLGALALRTKVRTISEGWTAPGIIKNGDFSAPGIKAAGDFAAKGIKKVGDMGAVKEIAQTVASPIKSVFKAAMGG